MNSLLLSLSSKCRLRPVSPILRSLSTRVRPVPAPRASITTPDAFLKSIGRSSDTKVSVETWDDLWQQDGTKLRSAGVGVRDRRFVRVESCYRYITQVSHRYILWCMEKFRSGLSPEEFAYDPTPKKTIRGWGPTVQDGKRIRSRRDRNKPSKASTRRALRFEARRDKRKTEKRRNKGPVTV
ncbi:hypothetical protein C8R45DRAFT_967743 [Mycena sanguinolenta]|nr:hypothetical protein C8R45DRAFT_967743 [Mycena sanguinolenta]